MGGGGRHHLALPSAPGRQILQRHALHRPRCDLFGLPRAAGEGQPLAVHHLHQADRRDEGGGRHTPCSSRPSRPTPLLPDRTVELGIVSASGARHDRPDHLRARGLRRDRHACRSRPNSTNRRSRSAPGPTSSSAIRAATASSWSAMTAIGAASRTGTRSSCARSPAMRRASRRCWRAMSIMIENPPVQDLDRIKKAGFKVVQGLSNRVIYLHMDQEGDAPGLTSPTRQEPVPRPEGARRRSPRRSTARASSSASWAASPQAAGELLPAPMFGTLGPRAGSLRSRRRQEADGRGGLSPKASRWCSARRTTAMSTTRRSPRPSRRCWRASTSR